MKKKKFKEIEYEESCGNVFADLDLPNPEEILAKSQLAWEIHRIIKKRKLTQAKKVSK
jgi:predicted XRE-type DNA-binding protein